MFRSYLIWQKPIQRGILQSFYSNRMNNRGVGRWNHYLIRTTKKEIKRSFLSPCQFSISPFFKFQRPTRSISTSELEKLSISADANRQDVSIQEKYIKALNELYPGAVLERLKNHLQYSINEEIIKEYIKAQMHTGNTDIQTTLQMLKRIIDIQQPSGTEKHPIYVKMSHSKIYTLLSLLSFLLFGGFLYFLFFRPGGGVDLFRDIEYHPYESRVPVTFQDVKGNDEAKQELADIVEYLKNPTKFARLNTKMPKGILLVGPPGCGKTLMARALAGEAKVPFFYTSGAEFEEMFVGVGARRVRNLFKKAKEHSPCIIFIDEIDAIGGRRDVVENRAKMTLNQLLVELDGFSQETHRGIIVIGATNLEATLDKALTRPGRFDRQVSVELPSVKARKEIFEEYIQDHAAPDVDTESLAKSTAGFSGADIFNVVNSAKIEATKLNLSRIPMRLFEIAKETVSMGPEKKSLIISDWAKKLTAYHESGHALMALYTPQAHEIVKATLIPRGHALGYVQYLPKDEIMRTKAELESRIDIAMGGRVAEEIIFGTKNVTGGAASDFEAATRTATMMVTKCGMSEKVGHISFDPEDLKNASTQTRALVESEIQSILEKSYKRAVSTLTQHEDELHKLASALLEFETLSKEEIMMVIHGQNLRFHKEQQKKLEEQQRINEKKYEVIERPLPALPHSQKQV